MKQLQFPKSILSLLLTVIYLSLSLPSCNSCYQALPKEPPAAAIDAAIEDASSSDLLVRTECLPQDWWVIFNDNQLTNFIETAFVQNPTLHAAHAITAKALFDAQRIRSILFPNILWGADVSRQKFSETGIIPFNTNPPPGHTPVAATGGASGIPVYFTQWETELTLTFDFDFWDKNKNRWKAALGEALANMADEAFLHLQLSINVAQVYFQLQVDYRRLNIAQSFLENRISYRENIQRRIQANLENAIALNSAEINEASARQLLLEIEGAIAINETVLKAYLAGDFDEEIYETHLIESSSLPKVPIPCDVPLHLISRRPDIIAQLWLIESAGKQIEVAKAGFYPDFNLTALFGYQTLHLHKLFLWPSSFFNVDPAVSLPIFDGGRLMANLRTSEVDYDLAIFHYNELVLNAAREVLEGIALLLNSDQQHQELVKTITFQENLLEITQRRLKSNLSSSLDALVSEGTLLIARDQEVIAQGKKIQAMLLLIKALGGGYEE